MIQVTLFSRKDCHLCVQVQADLESLQGEYPHDLVIVDIDSRDDLASKYTFDVPVVEAGSFTLKAPITRAELAHALAMVDANAPFDKNIIKPPVSGTNQSNAIWTKSDSFTYWFSKHYMLVFNSFFLLYITLPFLAPVMMKVGAPRPAALIYRIYGMVCHQLSYRSLFLFDSQLVYPRASAGLEGFLTYHQATGLGESNEVEDVFAARQFIGNPTIGYKVALCQRDIAIYGSIVLFGILFAVTGRRMRAIPWYLWVLFGLIPIGIDGLSQLLSQPPFSILPYRESIPFFRLMTGALFGFTTAWFGYPMIEQAMADSREMMEEKKRRIGCESHLEATRPDLSA